MIKIGGKPPAVKEKLASCSSLRASSILNYHQSSLHLRCYKLPSEAGGFRWLFIISCRLPVFYKAGDAVALADEEEGDEDFDT